MIEVNLPVGIKTVETEPLYQWNYGQKLRISGDGLPGTCQVHFCDRTCAEAIVRLASLVDVVHNTLEVAIPDVLLENEHTIHAFVYVVEEGTGYTIKQINIPVLRRTKPEGYIDPVPEVLQTELEQLILNINGALEGIEDVFDEALTTDELKIMINEAVGAGGTLTEEKANQALTTATEALEKANRALGQMVARTKIGVWTNQTLAEGENDTGNYVRDTGEYEVEVELTNINFGGLNNTGWNGIYTLKGFIAKETNGIYRLVSDGWIAGEGNYLTLKVQYKQGAGDLMVGYLTLLQYYKNAQGTAWLSAPCTGIVRNVYKRVTG